MYGYSRVFNSPTFSVQFGTPFGMSGSRLGQAMNYDHTQMPAGIKNAIAKTSTFIDSLLGSGAFVHSPEAEGNARALNGLLKTMLGSNFNLGVINEAKRLGGIVSSSNVNSTLSSTISSELLPALDAMAQLDPSVKATGPIPTGFDSIPDGASFLDPADFHSANLPSTGPGTQATTVVRPQTSSSWLPLLLLGAVAVGTAVYAVSKKGSQPDYYY